MADNVTLNAMSGGEVVATDQVGTDHYQRVKLDGGGDGVSVPIVAGQQLAAGSVPVVLTAAQITTLTPPAAITGFATESGGNLDTIAGDTTSIDGKITACNTGAVVVSSSALPTGASTAAKQPALGTAGTASSDVITVQGITSMTPILATVTATNLDVRDLTSASDSVAAVCTNAGTFAVQAACTLGAETTKVIGTVNIAAGQTVAAVTAISNALPAGNNNIGDVDVASIAAGDNNIGNVDVATIAAGDNNIGNVDIVSLPAGNIGQQAMAASVSVVPANNITDATYVGDIKFGEALPTGTNTIGGVTIPVHGSRVQGKVDNADTTTAREVLAAIASNYVYITSFIISVAAAGNYWLEDGDAAQITPKFYLAANGGVSWTCDGATPFKTTTVNKAINVKGSVAGAVGVMLTGYSSTT